MTSAQLQTLKEIFQAARELPPADRAAFLDGACGSDNGVRHKIEALLRSDQTAEDFIADPPAHLAAEVFAKAENFSDVGETVGRYKLIERIGSGGMGAVYLAQRADKHFEMRVAVKLIKRGMDTESVLRRFHSERQILASLEHPNIARLLDGGTTDAGLPYFVMEYINGQRIDQYADEHRLTIRERLELFRQVCAAVSYAHQHLVVHRDLKPSNILVTPEGVPKLLDFGIARIIQADEGAETLATLTALPMMTPEYASPEQIEGAHATTLSDVYSLGAVLYALLSGRPPYRFKSRSRQEISAAVSTAEVERPSAAITRVEQPNGRIGGNARSAEQISEAREGTVEKLQRRLRGDLDNIVLMAMRRETARRYRSVEQFSEDLRRHLAGRPVIARRDTLSYRAAKFVRRNSIPIAAATLLLVTLVGGIIATGWQASRARAQQARAERRFADVRKLANSVLFDYHDAITALPGATKVRERLVRDALTYLDSLATESQDDPELQRELAAAYERVGDVRGGASGGSLGDIAGAVESYAKALTIREVLRAGNPEDAQARRDLASSHAKIGTRLLTTKEASDGLEHLRKAHALYVELTREQPANDELQLVLADTSNKLGEALSQRNDFGSALEHYRAALALAEKLAANHPQEQRHRRALWNTHTGIAHVLYLRDDLPAAMEANGKALALGEALIAEDPINTGYRHALVANYKNGGDYRRRSDKAGALEYFRRAAALEAELVAADPANAATRRDLGYTHKRIADFLANLKENSQALSHFSKALEIFEKVMADAPADINSRFRAATCHAGVAGMQARLGDSETALSECRKAIALLGEITEDTNTAHHRALRAEAYDYVGYAYAALAASPTASASELRQHMTAAREMFQQSLGVLEDLRSRGILSAADEGWVKGIRAEIAKCDAALAR